MSKNDKSPKRRVQFDFEGSALEELETVQEAIGLNSRADLIRHALRFLYWAIGQMRSGHKLLIEKEDGTLMQIVFPFWSPPTKH